MILNRNNLWIGLGLGLVVPFVGYALFLIIYEQVEALEVISPSGFSPTFRERTLAVVAICLNLIPVRWFQRRRMTESMRGVMFSTMFFVLVWVIYFSNALFN